jgi:hypothetical protein
MVDAHLKACGREHSDHLRGELHADKPLQLAVEMTSHYVMGTIRIIVVSEGEFVWACHGCACCAQGLRSSCLVQPSYCACHVRQPAPWMGQLLEAK